jgi:Neocarzinostatin family
MHHVRRYRLPAALGVVLMVGLMVTALPASAAGPKVKASPKSNLSNNQTIMVSGKGFTKGDSVYILECVIGETSTTGSGCNINNLVPVTIGTKGTFPATPFTVKTGPIGTQGGTCGTSKTNFKACDISVGDAAGGDAGSVPIKFVK